MTTLSRDASAARLLLDLTVLSVKEPTRDRCVRPPSHQRAMCIFRPSSLVNSRVHDSHLCTRLSFATSASVVALVRYIATYSSLVFYIFTFCILSATTFLNNSITTCRNMYTYFRLPTVHHTTANQVLRYRPLVPILTFCCGSREAVPFYVATFP